MDLLQLAQGSGVPDTAVLADGNAQQILAWVIAFLIAALLALITWHLKTVKEAKAERKEIYEEHKGALKDLHEKREGDHAKMMKIALRTNKALEIWSGVQSELDDED